VPMSACSSRAAAASIGSRTPDFSSAHIRRLNPALARRVSTAFPYEAAGVESSGAAVDAGAAAVGAVLTTWLWIAETNVLSVVLASLAPAVLKAFSAIVMPFEIMAEVASLAAKPVNIEVPTFSVMLRRSEGPTVFSSAHAAAAALSIAFPTELPSHDFTRDSVPWSAHDDEGKPALHRLPDKCDLARVSDFDGYISVSSQR
jgi:hypothetical protein